MEIVIGVLNGVKNDHANSDLVMGDFEKAKENANLEKVFL